MIHRAVRGAALALTALAGVWVAPGPVWAQGGEGYLFNEPRIALTVRGGYSMPRAGSDLFSFTQEQLTVEKEDFNAGMLEGRFSVRVTPRVDVMFTVGGGANTTRSEFREWEGTDGLPITQDTRFSVMRVTFGGRYYLADRGRKVGRFAWVPSTLAPYLGADAGWVIHEFVQDGEFVDFETLDIFRDRFYSDGAAPTVQLMGGVDVSLNNRVVFNAEARYGWGSDELSQDFVGFERLDLAGLQLVAGFSVRF